MHAQIASTTYLSTLGVVLFAAVFLAVNAPAGCCPCADPPVRVVAEAPVIAEIEFLDEWPTPEQLAAYALVEGDDPGAEEEAREEKPRRKVTSGVPVKVHRIFAGDLGIDAPAELMITRSSFDCFQAPRNIRLVAIFSPWGHGGWILTWADIPSRPTESALLGEALGRAIACQAKALPPRRKDDPWNIQDRLIFSCWLDAIALGASFPEGELRRDRGEQLSEGEREKLALGLLERPNLDQIYLLVALAPHLGEPTNGALVRYFAELNTLDLASGKTDSHHLFELAWVLDDAAAEEEIHRSNYQLPGLEAAFEGMLARHRLAPPVPSAATRGAWQRDKERSRRN